jgi:hypothetical protein
MVAMLRLAKMTQATRIKSLVAQPRKSWFENASLSAAPAILIYWDDQHLTGIDQVRIADAVQG